MSESTDAAHPARHPRQNQLLAVAGVLIAAAIVLVLVVTLNGGSDGPAPGSPDAVVDSLAAALRAHDSAKVAALSCPSARAHVARETRHVLDAVTAASRHTSAETQGDLAVGQLAVTVPKGSADATVALQHIARSWCVASFAMALPAN
jgi:hypothetical protein